MKKRVAIADDDEALRDSLSVLLRFREYEVIEFGDGAAVLADPNLSSLDCLVLDLRMPGMSGQEVLETCRARGYNFPVIVVTAFGDIASAKKALKAGAFDFLEKPVDWEEMIPLIESAIGHYRESSRQDSERSTLDERMARLSKREREILDA